MIAPLLIRGARQLLTLRGPASPRSGFDAHQLAVISDGALLVRDHRIEQVGLTRRIENLSDARNTHVIDASGLIILPAFVDPDADIFGNTPTRLSLTRHVERLISHGTTALASPSHSRRAVNQLAQLHPPLTLAAAPPPDSAVHLLRSFARRELPDLAEPYAFASGFHPENQPASNMQTVIALACLQHGISPEQAITAVTFNAAHSIGLSATLGSLEPNKQADILLLDVPDYREIPYHFGVNLVRGVIQRGRVVYWRGGMEWSETS